MDGGFGLKFYTEKLHSRTAAGVRLMVGQVVLGKYKITRSLDEGGMSRIYLARNGSPDRDVVVKILKEDLARIPKAVEHFKREIHIMARFQHPHAVGCIDSS